MAFYKITSNRNEGQEKVCIYNKGCNFHCIGCAYKITSAWIGPSDSDAIIDAANIVKILKKIKPKRIHFLGGEPTLNTHLSPIAKFAHEGLGAITELGHSNGSGRVPDYIDEASISIKAFDEGVHRRYTGVSNEHVLENFADAYDRGIILRASTVLIPDIIPAEEIEQIARFVAQVDARIPFHITAYIPVPGVSIRAPTPIEIQQAMASAKKHLKNVTSTQLTVDGLVNLKATNPSFRSERVDTQEVLSRLPIYIQ